MPNKNLKLTNLITMTTIKSYLKFLENNYSILAISMLIIIIRIYLFSTEIHAQEVSDLLTVSENTINVEEAKTSLIPKLWNGIKNHKDDLIIFGLLGIYVTLMVMSDPTIWKYN